MNRIKKVFLVMIPILFISCLTQEIDISGKWSATRILETELNDTNNGEQIIGLMYVEQNISYNFAKDGTYTKIIVQNFKELKWLQEYDLIKTNNETILHELEKLNRKETICGSYRISNKNITFYPQYLINNKGDSININTIENIPKIIEIGKKEYKKLNSELYINNEFNKTEKFSLLHEKNN